MTARCGHAPDVDCDCPDLAELAEREPPVDGDGWAVSAPWE